MMDWMDLLQNLGLLLGGGGIGSILGYISKNGRKRDKADADAKVADAQRQMIDNYEKRISDLHSNIDKLNEAEDRHSERIAKKDTELDSKTEQIRNLTQKVWESEQEANRINARYAETLRKITRLTEERDHERLLKEYFKGWQCHHSDCDQRRPPNPSIRGQKFKEPK